MWSKPGVCTVMHMKEPSGKLLFSTDLKLGSYVGADSLLGMQTQSQMASHLLDMGMWHERSVSRA